MIDLDDLNPQQREAVTHGDGPLLVLAGAGSGKTRVITYRIAHLIGVQGISPREILAVTFTNKAAEEMLTRVRRLVTNLGAHPMMGTFHSTSLRILRTYGDRLGYTKSFTVYDTADQLTLVRRVARELSLSDDAFPPKTILSRISRAKNELISPERFERDNVDFFGSRIAAAFKLYQKRLREFDAMDFDDLIGQHVRLLREHEDVRDELRRRFRHLLIDEYQDTNHAQYALVKELAGEKGNVVAVGDEDQSIYRFRGADINNILNFERDFAGAKTVKLEQNYRSTGNILDAATGVVSQNVARKGKTLFTERGAGDPVRVVSCESEREEARFVINRILELRQEMPLREMAVLFRMNAQSRPFEEDLLAANIPYSVVGGVKFYERAEIKDVLAYLRLAKRREESTAIERVINTPSRGIGDVTFKALEAEALKEQTSLWTVVDGELPFLPERARKAVKEFRETIHDIAAASSRPLPELFEFVVVRSGYRKMLLESRDVQDESRRENIDELGKSVAEFYDAHPEASLADYLDAVTLLSDVDQYDQERGVTLMTLHAAKGLEFKTVFLAGMEEGILPHSQSRREYEDIEEERRLCYVGMTRARERLYLLHCYKRWIHGEYREQSRSPFLDEIPEAAIERVSLGAARPARETYGAWRERPIAPGRPSGSRPWATPARPSPAPSRTDAGTKNVLEFFQDAPVKFDPAALRPASAPRQDATDAAGGDYRLGSRVRHEQFGDGVILRMEGRGGDAKLTVYFDRAGTKKFIAKFAKLTRA